MLFLFVFAIGLVSWLYYCRHYNYWNRQSVPSIPITPILGNVRDLLLYRCCFGDQFKRLYDHPEADERPFVGIHVLHNRALLLRDPALIKRVLISDFSAFSSRFETTDPINDSMGSLNLFFAKYDVWKDIHKIFSPLFAYGKVKQMYTLLQQLPHDVTNNELITEVKEMCALFTTDMIASLAFGVHAHSLEQPEQGEFRRMCREVNDPRPKRILHLFAIFFFPQMVHRLGARLYSADYEQFMRQSIEFVTGEREMSGEVRHDLIDIFINLKRQIATGIVPSVVDKPDFFVAQAAFLLLAGFDTSSSTITFALYELAKHEHIQSRLRTELRHALQQSDGKLGYEHVHELQYLRMVVDEVLRLYPPTAFLDRCCTATDGYALSPWSDYHIPYGMPVYISVLGLHRDPKFWPNPLTFDPERFDLKNREQRTPMTYLPFGSGPRGCVGSVLGLLQVKIGLIHILKNYFVTPCAKTQQHMQFDAKAFVLAPAGGTYLRFVKDKLH